MKKIKLIIAGSRSFGNYELLKINLDNFFSSIEIKDVEIISGAANGADKFYTLFDILF